MSMQTAAEKIICLLLNDVKNMQPLTVLRIWRYSGCLPACLLAVVAAIYSKHLSLSAHDV